MGMGVLEAVEEEGDGRGGRERQQGGRERQQGGRERQQGGRERQQGGRERQEGGRSRLLVAWKRKVKDQNKLLQQVQRERDEHLRAIQSKLMVLESQLRRRQREVEALVEEKEATIRQQQQIILSLSRALHQATKKKRKKKKEELDVNNDGQEVVGQAEDGLVSPEGTDIPQDDTRVNSDDRGDEEVSNLILSTSKSDPESMNDSDSAIMLEDSHFDSLVIVPLGKGEVKVVRSVSDVVEVAGGRSGLGTGTSTTSSISHPTLLVSSGTKSLKSTLGACPGSLSTSSCSSEDSDESPASTVIKSFHGNLRTVYSLKEEQQEEVEDEDEIERSHLQQCDRNEDEVSLVPSSFSCSSSIAPSLHSILKSTSSYDSDATLSDGESEEDEEDDDDEDEERPILPQTSITQTHHHHPTYHHHYHRHHHHRQMTSERCQNLLGSYEKLNTLATQSKPQIRPEEEIQVTYNRVMSNHRSVTKPKDVKYRRINKAKSRSLEELRGKLKSWNDRAGKHSLSVDLDTQSFA